MRFYRPVIDKYDRQARTYDRRWNRSFGGALLQSAIDAVPWDRVQRVLDIGCGTGALESHVLQNGHPKVHIIGIDASFRMLRQAQAKLHGNGCGPISWNNALAESLPVRTASVDAVICANSFHYYRHPTAVLAEFRRVLKPGGVLVLADWCRDFLSCRIIEWGLRHIHQAGFRGYGEIQCHGVDSLASLLTSAGFQVEISRNFEIDWGWGAMIHRSRA